MDALAKSIVKMVASDAAAARRRQRQAGVLAGDMRCATVLGALGCGAFKNPPEEVADAFAVALRELAMRRDDGDAGVDLVAFGIVNHHNSPQRGKPGRFPARLSWLDACVLPYRPQLALVQIARVFSPHENFISWALA